MDPKHKGITLFLTPLRGGHVKMLVSEGFVPHGSAAAWTSVNNQLTISDEDKQYVQGGNYYVSVVPYDPEDPNKKNFDTKNWQFTLQYYSSANNMIELTEGHSTSARASVAKPAYFRFAVNKDDEDVEVKITQFGKPLQLFMATNPVNPYPTSDAADFTGINSIKLTRKDITQFCNQKEENGQITGTYCPVYLGVFVDSTVEGEQEFNINIVRTGQLINLQQGVPDTHAIPAKDWHADYAINPKKGENIQLSVVSDYVLEYYVSVYNTKENPHSFQWKANEGKDSVFSGLLGGNEHYGEGKIDIPHSLWKDFPEAMVIIRLKNTQKELPTTGKPPVMTVNYLGAYMYLMDSHVIFGRVVGGTYQYYKLSGDKTTKKPLKVVLTPLTSGLPELYLSHVDSGLQPSRDKYQFRSQDPSNPSISIHDAQGSYFLSVFSPNNCSYSLVFTNLEETFVHIKGGVPLSITSTASHEDGTYLVYTPTHKNRPFKVLYSKEAGNPELYFSAILDSDKHNELPTPKKHSHNTLDRGFITVLPGTMKDVKEYMIFMKNDGTQAENKATVLISEENQNAHLPSGKSFKDSVSQGNINYYYYTSPDLADDEHVEISLVVYNGNPKLIASTKPNVAENTEWSAVKDPAKKGSSIELKIMRESSRKLTSTSVLGKGQTLYIGVVGQSDALYDVRISVGRRTMSLEDGIITTGVLTSEEQKTFTFHSKFDDSEKKVVTLVYTIIDNDQGSVSSFPDIQIGYVPETTAATSSDRKVDDRVIEKNIEVRRSSSSRVYKFVAKKALYLITLTMPKQLSSTYSLSVNINGLVSLPPNNEILGYLAEKSSDIYQINVQRAGNLLIQFFECFGNSSISIAKSRQDYLNNNFDTSIQTSLQSSEFVIIQVPAGSVYLKVTGTKGLTIFTSLALEGNKALESAYKIAAYLIPSGHQIPQRMFKAGNQGKIEASSTDGKFHVKWDNLQLTDQGQSQSNIDIYETVYFSRSERALDMAAKCQLIPGSEFTFTLDHGEDMKVGSFSTMTNLQERVLDKEVELAGIADVDEGSSPLLVKITARVQPSAEESSPLYNLPVSVFYQKSEVSHKPAGSTILQRLKSILGNTYLASGLLIVIVGGVAWGCMKRRKQQQMIVGRPQKGQYELSRVKEVSQSESSPNPSPTKQLEYSDLQDDEEEEPVPEQDSVVGLKENKEEK